MFGYFVELSGMTTRALARNLCPPIMWRSLRDVRNRLHHFGRGSRKARAPEHQALGIYWDPTFAQELETWGENNAWAEIQLLLSHAQGRVLDIACGTGKVIEINSRFQLELHGCDISDLLIDKAKARGIADTRLRVCDATASGYEDEAFDYSYSIGSLEHFTEDGIGAFLRESFRVTRQASFHQIPTSRSGTDEGWIAPYQSYFNNSVDWWLPRFLAVYPVVHVLHSSWADGQSVGKWFICLKADSTGRERRQ